VPLSGSCCHWRGWQLTSSGHHNTGPTSALAGKTRHGRGAQLHSPENRIYKMSPLCNKNMLLNINTQIKNKHKSEIIISPSTSDIYKTVIWKMKYIWNYILVWINKECRSFNWQKWRTFRLSCNLHIFYILPTHLRCSAVSMHLVWMTRSLLHPLRWQVFLTGVLANSMMHCKYTRWIGSLRTLASASSRL